MVLSAAIEGVDTKVSYTEDANVLKAAWKAGDKISLVAIDASGNALSNDVFETTTAGASAKFSGTYSNPDGAVMVSVFYPALTEGKGTETEPWQSKKREGTGLSDPEPLLYDLKKGNSYISVRTIYQLQRGNGDMSNVAEAVVMRGKITDFSALVAGDVNVTLKSICYVVKVTAKVPSGCAHLTRINLNTSNSASPTTPMGFIGWTRLDDMFGISYGNSQFYSEVGLGTEFQSGGSSLGTGVSPDGSGNIVAYIIGYTGAPCVLPSGTVLAIKAGYGNVPNKFNATKTLSEDISLEPGKMYRVNVTLNE